MRNVPGALGFMNNRGWGFSKPPVALRQSEIDSIIKTYADNWEIERMAALDKNILRTAIYEMKYMENIPPVVSINEAIDMAKKYSTRDSGKFVNGILDKIHKKLILQEKNP